MVFYCHVREEHTIIVVATNDMVVTSKRMVNAEKFKSIIKTFWDIIDHGPIQWFLGFEIKRNRKARTISINQQVYIETMVEKFGLTSTKKTTTPMEQNTQFSIQQCPATLKQMACMKGIPYAEAIGLILWPTVVSRPYMAFAVSVLSQFIQNPGPVHWDGVKRVNSYLATTKDLWLTFGGGERTLQGYCNAD